MTPSAPPAPDGYYPRPDSSATNATGVPYGYGFDTSLMSQGQPTPSGQSGYPGQSYYTPPAHDAPTQGQAESVAAWGSGQQGPFAQTSQAPHATQPQQSPYPSQQPQPYAPQPYLQLYSPQLQAPAPLQGGPSWLFAVAGTLFAFLAVSIAVSVVVVLASGALQVHASLTDLNTVANVLSQLANLAMGALWFHALVRESRLRSITFKGNPQPRLLSELNPRTQLRRPGRRLALDLLACVAVGVLLQMFVSSILTIVQALSPDALTSYNEHIEQIVTTTPLSFVSLVVLAPLSEELVFRGVALEYGRRTSPRPVLGIVAASLAFGIAHLEPTQGLYTFAIGLLFALIALRGGGIWASICVHAALNLSSYFTNTLLWPFLQLDIPGLLLSCALTAVAILLLTRFLTKGTTQVREEPRYTR